MGQRFSRKKQRNFLNSVIYRKASFSWFSYKYKFNLFSNLSWIFNRLAHEAWMSFYAHSELHPSRLFMYKFVNGKFPLNATVLDIGCGYGEISGLLGRTCKSITGIDQDPDKVRIAIERYSNSTVKFVCGDAMDFLNVNQKHYDVLVCSHILEHLDDPYRMLANFKAYFDFIYIEVPDFEASYINIVRQTFNNKLNYQDDDHIHEYDRDEMIALILSLDMRIIDSDYRNGVMRFWVKV